MQLLCPKYMCTAHTIVGNLRGRPLALRSSWNGICEGIAGRLVLVFGFYVICVIYILLHNVIIYDNNIISKIILVTWRPMLVVSILMFMVDQRTSLSQGSPLTLRYIMHGIFSCYCRMTIFTIIKKYFLLHVFIR
jgi:hypothetical protein